MRELALWEASKNSENNNNDCADKAVDHRRNSFEVVLTGRRVKFNSLRVSAVKFVDQANGLD